MAKVFVFGSNLAGRHGKGSALHARYKYGAIYGQGAGRQGNSYAIPTKDRHLKILPIGTIAGYVLDFFDHVREHPEDTFHVVAIGCGLAGYDPKQIAPLFINCPPNVNLPEEFK